MDHFGTLTQHLELGNSKFAPSKSQFLLLGGVDGFDQDTKPAARATKEAKNLVGRLILADPGTSTWSVR
jgi:hypothetical protein